MKLNAIKQMENYARYNEGIISLSQGIPFMNSENIIRQDVFNAISSNLVDKYSDPRGVIELRNLISKTLSDEKMQYSPDEVMVTAGAIEGLSSVFLSIIKKTKNEVIIPTPAYSAYFRIVKMAGGKPLQIPLNEIKGWELDMKLLKKSINKKTSAILLCNPNNPTGSVYSRETLIDLAGLARELNIYLIVDEVYKNMIFDDADFYTPAVQKEFRKNVIRVVSFSKDFSLTGWRIGYLHSDISNIEKILPVHDSLVNCAPVVSQYAAISAIKNQDEILADNLEIYKKHRVIVSGYLDRLGDLVAYTMPKGSYYFFPKLIGIKNTQSFCMNLLKEAKVAVVPGSDFGPGGEGHIRICFGRREENLITGLDRLTEYLATSNSYIYGR